MISLQLNLPPSKWDYLASQSKHFVITFRFPKTGNKRTRPSGIDIWRDGEPEDHTGTDDIDRLLLSSDKLDTGF